MWGHTKKTQDQVTPEIALEYLKEGNQRFINNLKINRIFCNRSTRPLKDSSRLQ
jgi:carbonic anhydrase